jgi:hypothetical protein
VALVRVGFTGTRDGMTNAQREALSSILGEWADSSSEFHHGCCVGADAEAHRIHRERSKAPIIGWTGPNDEQRGVADHQLDEVRPRQSSFFARNRSIVNAVDVMIATPRYMWEEDKGGTWYTIRYARKVGRTIYVAWPDGSVTS